MARRAVGKGRTSNGRRSVNVGRNRLGSRGVRKSRIAKRGFASMGSEQRREIARMGGEARAKHNRGLFHRLGWDKRRHE